MKLTTVQAIKYVAENFEVTSMYGLAKSLSNDEVKVQPVQISNYLKGTRMSQKVADRFLDVYGIIITDAHNPSDFAQVLKALQDD